MTNFAIKSPIISGKTFSDIEIYPSESVSKIQLKLIIKKMKIDFNRFRTEIYGYGTDNVHYMINSLFNNDDICGGEFLRWTELIGDYFREIPESIRKDTMIEAWNLKI